MFPLQALILNSDLSDPIFGRSVHIVILNVANIRFQCQLVAVLKCPACEK